MVRRARKACARREDARTLRASRAGPDFGTVSGARDRESLLTGSPRADELIGVKCVPAAITALALICASAPAAVDEPVEVSIMELTSIDWSPGKRLPKWIRALDGERVSVTGYMALNTEEGSHKFRQTWDQCGCSTLKASHFIEVDLGDETTGYNPDQFTVIGTFSASEVEEDGFVVSLYRLKAESME